MPITALDRLLVTRQRGGLLPLSSPTTLIGAGSISGTATNAIGFPFTFDGTTYTGSFFVRVAGYVRLAGSINSSTNANLVGGNNSVILAPWWDACGTALGGDGVRTELQGTAPWRRRVIEFHLGMNGTNATNNHIIRVQVVLYETSNVAEFRFGPRVQLGTGASATASVGFKGDTTFVASNYRDVSADLLALGGRNTSGATNLNATNYDSFAAWGIVRIEPNWPMCGLWVDFPPSMLVSADPLTAPGPDLSPSLAWRIANNTNWLYCNHMPALLNLSPISQGTTYDPAFVAPVTPSADNLVYEVQVGTWSPAGGTCELDLGWALTSSPQPAEDGDWTSLAIATEATAAGLHWWANTTVSLDPNTTFLRFDFDAFDSGGSMRATSIIVRPRPLTDFDPTSTFASGFVPMGLGQIGQSDAGIHAEWLNRAFRNVARVLADRGQCLWSAAWIEDVDYVYSGVQPKPVRVLGAAPCALPWPGQTVILEAYSHDTNETGRATMTERGGRSASVEANTDGGTFGYDSAELELIGATPLCLLTVDPALLWRAMYVGLRWVPNLLDADLIEGIAPPARYEYLAALAAQLEKGRQAWSMTGLAVRLERVTDEPWRVAWVVPPDTEALRPLIARGNNGSSGAQDTTIVATTSGVGGADEIIVPSTVSRRDAWPPEGGSVEIAAGASVFDATPATAMDRLLESPTATAGTPATVERVEVTYGVGMTLVPWRR